MKRYAVQRELYLESPPGVCIHVVTPTYTGNEGRAMIQSVWYEARNPSYMDPDPARRVGMVAYFPKIFRRYSDDNGQSWRTCGEVYTEDGYNLVGQRRFPSKMVLDPRTNLLVGLFITYETYSNAGRTERYSDAGIWTETHRMRYDISRDAGQTWEPSRALILKGGTDETHWGPGLVHGQTAGQIDAAPRCQLSDGTLLAPMELQLDDVWRFQVALVHGRWKPDLSDLEWEMSDRIRIGRNRSSQGLCEADIAVLGTGRLLVSMRACGDRESKTYPSLKFWSVSSDGGWTFTEPRPLVWDDGTEVWSPSSFHRLFRSSVTKKLYMLANILDRPTFDSEPRWPLAIAEIDEDKICLIRETFGIIQGLPEDLSEPLRQAARERRKGRRYSNWSQYEDRETRELVLLMAEQPKTDWQDFTADNYRYRINFDAM